MFARVFLPVAATCWLTVSAEALQLWDAEGLSHSGVSASIVPEPRSGQLQPVASLIADILDENYRVELPEEVHRGRRPPPDRRRRDDATQPPPTIINNTDVKESIAVVAKCCPMGQNLSSELNTKGEVTGRSCAPSDLPFKPIFYDSNRTDMWLYDSNDWRVIVDNPCIYGKFVLDPINNKNDVFYLLTNGSLIMPFSKPQTLSTNDFCMEVFWTKSSEKDGEALAIPVVCFPAPSEAPIDNTSPVRLVLIAIVMLMSVPLLVLTTVAYLVTPELRDNHGKCLANYCGCLAVAFFALALTQLSDPDRSTAACVLSAVFIQVAFLGYFVWLTIMCYDIYRNTKYTSECRNNTGNESKVMRWYNTIGWSVTLLLILITYTIEYAPGVPLFMHKPNFDNRCWFKNDTSTLIYFYGPVAILLASNFVFFGMTFWIIKKSNNVDANMNGNTTFIPNSSSTDLRTGYRDRTLKLKRLLKKSIILSAMMGLNWFLEIITWAIKGSEWKWILFDLINAGQGFIIFSLFMKKEQRQYFFRWLRNRFEWMTCLPISPITTELPREATSIELNGVGVRNAVNL